MPSKSPPLAPHVAATLTALGERIRAQRERQKVSATDAAEAAGVSRVTLHRIERGEPSVTIGAYLGALSAVGLQWQLVDPAEPVPSALPEKVRVDDYPALKQLAWQLPGVTELSPVQALDLYERNWRHLDRERLLPQERRLLQTLVDELGGGRLLV